jgi:hypothetical protein
VSKKSSPDQRPILAPLSAALRMAESRGRGSRRRPVPPSSADLPSGTTGHPELHTRRLPCRHTSPPGLHTSPPGRYGFPRGPNSPCHGRKPTCSRAKRVCPHKKHAPPARQTRRASTPTELPLLVTRSVVCAYIRAPSLRHACACFLHARSSRLRIRLPVLRILVYPTRRFWKAASEGGR